MKYMKRNKPRVGDLVKIDKDYPNTEAAGHLALVIKTLGIECIVEPICPRLKHGKPWWFDRTHLEVVSAGRKLSQA
tara:strand:+ start:741 stop:968 length:228 start_codon:yes stop_codon:yes gene_type:complete